MNDKVIIKINAFYCLINKQIFNSKTKIKLKKRESSDSLFKNLSD